MILNDFKILIFIYLNLNTNFFNFFINIINLKFLIYIDNVIELKFFKILFIYF